MLLLAGEDTWLKVYDVHHSHLLGRLKVFYSQPIHGIHISQSDSGLPTGENGLLLWGGHSVTFLPHSTLQSIIDGTTSPHQPVESHAPDWIYDGILFPDGNRITGTLVTAHNEILPISINANDGCALSFGPLTSPSRPILYSANLCLLQPGVVLVAGGTVFGEIIVWKYEAATQKWEVLYVFTGHEGSIFGVSISPEMRIGPKGEKVRLLASCSDDRTVRVWDISERPIVSGTKAKAGNEGTIDSRALAEARETGFGGNSEAKEGNRNDASRCVAVAMGHVSRIWHVKFGRRTDQCGVPIEVQSFGEDCSRQRWELSLDLERWRSRVGTSEPGTIGTLTNCGANTCHSGKNIWSVAVLGRGEDDPLIATGGADGKIVVFGEVGSKASIQQKTYEDLDLSVSLEEVLESIEGSRAASYAQGKQAPKNAFQRYAFLSDERLMATTSSGRLFLATIGASMTWEEVPLPETIISDLRSWNIVKSPARDTALLGSVTGKVYLFQEGREIREIAHLPSKISDIILVDPSPVSRPIEEHAQPWSVTITVLGLDHALILNFDPSTSAATIDSRHIILPEHYIVTAATFCNDTLILGSRTGNLTLYAPDPVSGSSTPDFLPVTSRKDPKTKDAITRILPLPSPNPSNAFIATCRDGKYRTYTITPSSSPSQPMLNLLAESSPPLTTIESAFFASSSSPSSQTTTTTIKKDLILHGISHTTFLAHNASSNTTLASVPCGGAHRAFAAVTPCHYNYDQSCGSDAAQMRLVFQLAGRLRVWAQGGVAKGGERVVRRGGHGREIRGVTATGGNGVGYVATGAEDTSIRIWKRDIRISSSPDEKAGEMKCVAVVQGHSAGIQSLQWFSSGEKLYLLSSAGSEELFVWKVGTVQAGGYEAVTVMREAVWGDKTRDGDLRIVNFDVATWGEWEKEMLVTMGMSDSSVRSYVYSMPGEGDDSGKGEFKLLASGRYTGACPTQARHLRTDGEAGEVHVLMAYTDGHVAVWRTEGGSGEFELALVVRLHQSSIKSLDLSTAEAPARWMVVTGGDDNALGFLDLKWENDKGYSVARRSRVKDAHAAAVTGLCTVKQESGLTEVLTASNDQRIKLWRAERTGDGLRVSLVNNRYSAVADAGELELITPGKVVVGGVGMEVWDV